MAVRSAATKQKGIRAVKDRSLIAGRSELKEFLRHDRVDAIRLPLLLPPVKKDGKIAAEESFGAQGRHRNHESLAR